MLKGVCNYHTTIYLNNNCNEEYYILERVVCGNSTDVQKEMIVSIFKTEKKGEQGQSYKLHSGAWFVDHSYCNILQ
jgi:hypothetical protein